MNWISNVHAYSMLRELKIRWAQRAWFAIITFNGPAQVGEKPLALTSDQLKRVDSAVGKSPIDIKVIGRPERGDISLDQNSGTPCSLK